MVARPRRSAPAAARPRLPGEEITRLRRRAHFEIYPSLAPASDSDNKLATSQLALHEDTCEEVYATTGYEASVSNLSKVSLDSDNVFGDDSSLQVAEVTGSAWSGFTATLTVAIEA